ncbi:MAG: hypothetical protein ACREM3_16665 [Candidatus Rokuibacteriota bacterium]
MPCRAAGVRPGVLIATRGWVMYETFWQIVAGFAALAAFVGLVAYRTWQERRERERVQRKGQGAVPETATPRRAG